MSKMKELIKKGPLLSCQQCGVQMERQRFSSGRLEDFTRFTKRKFCSKKCRDNSLIKDHVGKNQFRWRVEKCLDFVMRLEHTLFSNGQTHGSSAWDFLEGEKKRIGTRSLAGDTDLYASIQFAAILSHPCQSCSEDKNAWHTRRGFCGHREDK